MVVNDQKPTNWNLPNVLTSLRIIAIPPFAWLVLSERMWWALGVFVVLMITDKLDGDIARSRGLVTDFGKIADPIADKALMITALVCLNLVGLMPWWITVVIVFRELGITIWRMFELRKGNVVPASRGGKLKTVLQAVAVALYLIPGAKLVAFPVMLAAVAITVVTGVQYVVEARKLNAK